MSDMTNDVRTKVLIAEDDAIVALDLQGMVMRLGFDVVAIAENGQTAIAAARRFQPDVILLDMVLSGPMDGIEVAKEIHKLLDIPIIFCVVSPDLTILARAKDISYAGYLLKPINPDSLATTLDTVLYKYKLEKRVNLAEAKYRKLAETCEILNFFTASGASYSWLWQAETGAKIAVEGSNAESGIPNMEAAIDSAVKAFLSSPTNSQSDGRIARLLEISLPSGLIASCAVIGVSENSRDTMAGIIVPLERPGA